MLTALEIRNVVLVEHLALNFSDGLTVLTGETGAGKSILLDALALALGARGDAQLIRAGAERGQVTAVFEPPTDHPALAALAENGIEADGAVILRRTQMRDGKSRAYVNDQACSVALLKAIGAMLVEIHGQHDDRALVDTDAHRLLLDAFGGLAETAGAVATLYHQWREAERTLRRHREKVEAAAREAAMANVQSVAQDTAQAIVQKLTGTAATAAELAAAGR